MLEDILTIIAGLPSGSVKTTTQFFAFRYGRLTGATAGGASAGGSSAGGASAAVSACTEVN